jgi:hypothetical protein
MFRRAKKYLEEHGHGDLCPHEVSQMEVIRWSYGMGYGPCDMEGKLGERGAEDYNSVWQFVQRKLGMKD